MLDPLRFLDVLLPKRERPLGIDPDLVELLDTVLVLFLALLGLRIDL